jgi:hypothetical protein
MVLFRGWEAQVVPALGRQRSVVALGQPVEMLFL